ncbi:hypothetical protein P8452_38570 [Trifolium repens]|nr:hypothetical protein P8452_38570 [Trifolium repens]
MPPPIFTRVPSFRLPSVRRCNRARWGFCGGGLTDQFVQESEIVASDVSVNDDSEDDSDDITNWAIHDDESRQRSDRSRKHLERRLGNHLQRVMSSAI